MTFTYFAYGSNMWPPQMGLRCPSATPIGNAALPGWAPAYDKPGADGSAKLNIVPSEDDEVLGVLYEIADEEREALDAAEPGYDAIEVQVLQPGGTPVTALTYRWTGLRTLSPPRTWYVAMAQEGARTQGLPAGYYGNHLGADGEDDPSVGGLRVATPEDLPQMQDIVSDALTIQDGRYTPHPGDLAWWMWHPTPRQAIHDSFWLQGDRAVLFINSDDPGEITAIGRPGEDRTALVAWARHRLGGRGEVAWVGDDDEEMVAHLESQGLAPVWTNRSYLWDLDRSAVPDPDLPEGWVLRHLEGEHEADNRRTASHRAFRSKMDEAAHLERYLKFMRSAAYEPERDLVAVAPDGRIASFVVWWPDRTGIAQIEPFGTHPDFQRQGVGRALLYHALIEMREAGMHRVRVVTDEPREDATGFYAGVGFEDVGRVRWWA